MCPQKGVVAIFLRPFSPTKIENFVVDLEIFLTENFTPFRKSVVLFWLKHLQKCIIYRAKLDDTYFYGVSKFRPVLHFGQSFRPLEAN